MTLVSISAVPPLVKVLAAATGAGVKGEGEEGGGFYLSSQGQRPKGGFWPGGPPGDLRASQAARGRGLNHSLDPKRSQNSLGMIVLGHPMG